LRNLGETDHLAEAGVDECTILR